MGSKSSKQKKDTAKGKVPVAKANENPQNPQPKSNDMKIEKEKAIETNAEPFDDKGTTAAFPLSGISLDYLRNLLESAQIEEDWTIGELCERFVKPKTAKAKLSYVAYLVRDGKEQSAHVSAKADFFVSYAWKYTIGQVLSALSKRKGFIWMDVFVVNQHTSSEVDLDGWLNTFGGAIQQIGLIVPILIPWLQPVPLTRSWCTFEFYTASMFKIPTECEMLEQDKEDFKQYMATNQIDGPTLQNIFSELDVETASAFKPSDREAILAKIQRDGSARVNDLAMQPLKRWLVTCGNEAIEEYSQNASPEDQETMMELGNVQAAMGSICNFVSEMESAINWQKKAIQTWREAGADDILLAIAINNAAVTTKQLGRLDEALPMYYEALALRRKHLDEYDHQILQNRNNIALLLLDKKEYEQTAEIAADVLAKYRTIGREDYICTTSGTLGYALMHLNRLEESQAAMEEALSIAERIYGNENVSTAIDKNNLATLLLFKKTEEDAKRAKELCDESYHVLRRVLGDKHCLVGVALSLKGLCECRLGQLDDGTQLGMQGLQLIIASLGLKHPMTVTQLDMWQEFDLKVAGN